MPALHEAVEQILDAVCAAVASDPALSEIEEVIRGERARPMPRLPAIWVVPEPATQDGETFGAQESWTMPITLAAVVGAEDPEQGARDAARLAARARAAVLRSPALELDWITWVRSVRVDLAARSAERNRTVYWADATVEVRFTTEEP
jgi:hypothetical protein